jgi:hypothetical protein
MAQWPGLHRHHEVFSMTTLRFEMQFSCSGEDNRRVHVFWDVKLSSGEWSLMFWGARCNHLQGSRGPWKCQEPLTQWQSIVSQVTYMLRNSAVRISNLTKWEWREDRTWTVAPVRTVSYTAIWRGLLHSFYDLLKIRPPANWHGVTFQKTQIFSISTVETHEVAGLSPYSVKLII